jgi:hypothetical protein
MVSLGVVGGVAWLLTGGGEGGGAVVIGEGGVAIGGGTGGSGVVVIRSVDAFVPPRSVVVRGVLATKISIREVRRALHILCHEKPKYLGCLMRS